MGSLRAPPYLGLGQGHIHRQGQGQGQGLGQGQWHPSAMTPSSLSLGSDRQGGVLILVNTLTSGR